MSFIELKAEFDIPQKYFFKYLQLRSGILTRLNNSTQQPPFSTSQTLVTKICVVKKTYLVLLQHQINK